MSQQQTTAVATDSISLDTVFKALQHWRKNRKSYEGSGIPDKVWLMIFELEGNGYTGKELRRLFTLNSQQYSLKRNELCHEKNTPIIKPTNTPKPDITQQNNSTNFSEAIISVTNDVSPVPSLTQRINQTKQAIVRLKSPDNRAENYLDTSTIIVECIRPDGHRLKIHTTTDRLDTVMQTFYNQKVVLL